MPTKIKPHPDLVFAHKSAGLTVALFHVLLNNQKHYQDKHKEEMATINAAHVEVFALRQLQYLDALANYLHDTNGIAPDELKTALGVIQDLHNIYKERFAPDAQTITNM